MKHYLRARRQLMDDLLVIFSVLVVLAVMMSFSGTWPTTSNPYNSYSLQACAWLEGRLDLGQDYSWLELAIYQDKYYVSFPPFPSYLLLPFCLIFGSDTPDHWINLCVTALGIAYALRLYRRLRREQRYMAFFVLFLYLGNGYLHIALQGWVWHLAQCLCFTLSFMALTHAVQGQGGISLTCWACAVGCRPMVIIYLPFLVYLIWQNRRPAGVTLLGLIRRRWYWVIGPGALALSYMLLNYFRFGSILEFGHNYLPEFTRTTEGQFSLSYFWNNLPLLFRLPPLNSSSGAVQYYIFDCQMFYFIAPIFFAMIAAWICGVIRHWRERRATLIGLPILILVHFFILLCHRTLGGWQWGNRYLVDMQPYLFAGLLLWAPEKDGFAKGCMPLFFLGAALNIIGSVATYAKWI